MLIVPQQHQIFNLLPSRVSGNKQSIHPAINPQKERKGAETTADYPALWSVRNVTAGGEREWQHGLD